MLVSQFEIYDLFYNEALYFFVRGAVARAAESNHSSCFAMITVARPNRFFLCSKHHHHASAALFTIVRRISSTSPSQDVQGSTSTTTESSSNSATLPTHSELPPKSPAEAHYESFYASVKARTVGNKNLRQFLQSDRHGSDISVLEAAVKGCRDAGLRIDATTSEVLLGKLVEAGKLKAALELHSNMTRERVTPTSNAYNILMRLCLERDMPASVETLFEDMNKRGRSPNSESYEIAIAALATESPPKWERAVILFDKITRDRTHKITAQTYNALMRVYLNMTPFDWRVVYNCYYELRQLHPTVLLTWDSYALVKEAFTKGNAGRIRRWLTFIDAWFVLTHIRSVEFWCGVALFVTVVMTFKTIIGYLIAQWGKRYLHRSKGQESESGVLVL